MAELTHSELAIAFVASGLMLVFAAWIVSGPGGARWRAQVGGMVTLLARDQGGAAPSATALALAADSAVQASVEAPWPMWRTDPTGTRIWSNRAYDDLCQRLLGEAGPALDLFAEDATTGSGVEDARRYALNALDGSETLCFDVYTRSDDADERGALHFALPVDAIVRAEASQRDFIQTLTKTFAQLSIGLAIFDRTRRLALFNPALIDLTDLSASFLSQRPYINSFFDQMREKRIMPEPKNYITWRERMATLEAAAREGDFEEVWTSDRGLTFRISGRPHPNGALAFLIEDISAEITATRQLRAQLQMMQAVLNHSPEAMCVFSQSGAMLYCNAAYRALFKVDPDSAFATTTVTDAQRHWTEVCGDNPAWPQVRDFVLSLVERRAWQATLPLRDGSRVRCHATPLQGSSTLLVFAPQARESREQSGIAKNPSPV